MANDLKILQGFDGIVMVRDLAKAKTEDAKMVPYLTSTDFELSRDSDSTATKSGNVAKVGGLETSFSFETLDSTSETLDLLHKSLVNKTTLEFWFVKLGLLGTDGQKVFAHYMRGRISKDSESGDPDDNGTREFEVAVDGEPKDGYTKIPEGLREQINYIFQGLLKNDGTNGEDGSGAA